MSENLYQAARYAQHAESHRIADLEARIIMLGKKINDRDENIHSLRAQVEALTKERDLLRTTYDMHDKYLAAQARIADLWTVIDKYAFKDSKCICCGAYHINTHKPDCELDRVFGDRRTDDSSTLNRRLAEERERCAKVCDELAEYNRTSPTDSMWQWGECAAAIRSMGK